MAFGTSLKGADLIPIAQVYAPLGFQALQGSPLLYTDALLNASTGVVSADQIQTAIMNGKGFTYTTGLFATATNANLVMGMSVFNPLASGKSIYVYSIKWYTFTANVTLNYRLTTTDPAFANAITATNDRPGAGLSVANITSAANAATASVALSGTTHDIGMIAAQGTLEFLAPNAGILLPAGVANGITVYGTVTVAAQNWGATMRGIEF